MVPLVTETCCELLAFPAEAIKVTVSPASIAYRSIPLLSACSNASVKEHTPQTSGITPLPDCSAAPFAISCQRSCFFTAFFSSNFTTERFAENGTIL